jgi:release factor glutamine methyltransferase
MTLREAFALGKDLFKTSDIEEYETDAWLLLEAATGCTRTDLYVRPDTLLTEEQETLYRDYLEKRKSRFRCSTSWVCSAFADLSLS